MHDMMLISKFFASAIDFWLLEYEEIKCILDDITFLSNI